MSEYTIRIRFRLPPSLRLGIDRAKADYEARDQPPVALESYDDAPVREADWLVLLSRGWSSEEEATAGAERLADALRLALSRVGMSADLGRRAPRGGVYRGMLDRLEEAGRPALNDEHGPMVFASDPPPLLSRVGSVRLTQTLQPERWEKAFLFALNEALELTERERVAFDLYDAAFWVRESQDARFVLLFAAIEVLLEDVKRPEESLRHVDRLIELTEEAGITEEETDSLVGSLRWLRLQSIRARGRRLVRGRLPGRRYGKRTAEKLFLECYDLRNQLLHGRLPFPSREAVGRLAAPLEQMVGHLIAAPLTSLDV